MSIDFTGPGMATLAPMAVTAITIAVTPCLRSPAVHGGHDRRRLGPRGRRRVLPAGRAAFTRIPGTSKPPAARQPLQRDLADGWSVFRSMRWVIVMTISFALVNAFKRRAVERVRAAGGVRRRRGHGVYYEALVLHTDRGAELFDTT
jgi:hypothetical protein